MVLSPDGIDGPSGTPCGTRRRIADSFRRLAWQLRQLRKTHRYLRLNTSIVEGVEPHSGTPLRLLCAGPLLDSRFLLEKAFAGDYRESQLGRVGLWHLARAVESKGRDAELSLVTIPPALSRVVSLRYHFAIPSWLLGEIGLSADGGSRPNRSVASDLRRIRKNRLEPEFVDGLQEFDDFYHNMHVPLTRHSHGPQAYVTPYASLKKWYRDCELLLVRKDGLAVAGMLIAYDGKRPRLWKLGVRPPVDEHQRLGAVAAVYHFALERLKSQGHERVGAGFSRSLLNDGVLRYKRKWNQRISAAAGGWLLLGVRQMTPAVESFLVHHPFVHCVGRRLRGAVFIERDRCVDEEMIQDLAARYCMAGLEKVILYRVGRDGAHRADAPDGFDPNGMCELPGPRDPPRRG